MGNFDKVEKSNHRHLAKCVVFFIAVSIIFMLAFFLSFRKVENEHTYVATATTADTIRVNTLDGLQNAINAKIYNEIIVENEIVLTDGVVVDGIKESGERTVVRVEVLGTTDQGVIQSSSSEQHVFTVRKGATATLRNLIIKGGSKTAIINGESSSSLENNSKLICENLTISNASNSSAGGGGICNTKGCTTIMKKCNIVRNSAKYGGGFQNQQGLFIMEDCSVSENRSFSNGGGGGENTGESTSSRDAILYLINTTVANNTSDEIGGGINAKNGMLYIINSTISGNITSHTTLSADRNCGGGIGNNGSYIYAINSLLTDNIDYKQVSGQTQGVPSDIGIYTTTSDASKNVLVGCMYGSISPQGPDDGSEKNIQVTANNANIYASKNQSSFIKRDGTSDPNYVFDYPALVANDAGILTAPLADQSIANDEQVEETFFYYPQNVTYATKNLIYSGYTPSVGSEKVAFTGEYSAAVDAGRVVPDYIGAGSPIQASEKIITIRVQSNDDFTIDGGSVFGDSFIINTTVGKDITLKANQKEGKEDYAVVWYDSKGSLLSGKNPYSFNTTDNITIQPTSFSVTAKTEKNSNSVQLEWTALDNITDYTLYYGEIDLFEKYSVTQQYSATSATINGLEYGKTYYFWVVPMSNDIVFNSAKASVSIQGGKNNKNAPTNISKVDQQKIGVNDGMITNVDDTMEYFAENEWKKITGNSVSNLAPGEYPVRYAEADNYFASPSVVVTILKKEITSLEIISQPKLKSYICGQTLDLSSLEIKISYSTNTIVRVGYDSFTNRDSYDSINQIQVSIGAMPIEQERKLTYTDNGSVITISCDGKQTETDSLEVIQSYSVTVTNPTCTDKGYTTHTCSGCGHSYKDNPTEVIEHSFSKWVYNNDGKHTKTCSVCKSIETEECKYDTVVTDPTCTDAGYTTHKCSGCGHSYQDNITNATGHSFGEWESKADGTHTKTCLVCKSIETEECKYGTEVTNPTCIDKGYTTHTCSGCGHSYQDNITNATGHSFGEWESKADGKHTKTCLVCKSIETEECKYETEVTDPTCTTQGYTTHTCKDCEHSYTVDGDSATGHSFGEWESKADGKHTKTCSVCKSIETEECKYETEVTNPTCTDKGYTTHTCSGCGHSYQDNPTEVIEHSFGQWVYNNDDGTHTKTCTECMTPTTENCDDVTDVIDPTCIDKGYTTHKCSGCGHSYTVDGELATGHSFGQGVYNNNGTHTKTCTECMTPTTVNCDYSTTVIKPTCTDKGYTTHKCSGCGHNYTVDGELATGHSFGEWKTTVQATCVDNGEEKKTCLNAKCEKTETKVILAKHTCKQIESKEATCTENGNIDYWQCEVCYLYFSDNKAEEQINLADTTIFALNHNYQAATYVWADNYDCTGKRICSRDKTHIEEFTMKAKHEVIQELSCLEDETVRYTAIFEQTGFETQTKTIITKAAQHFFELNLTQDEAPTCTEKGSKSKHCSKCSMTTDKTSINPLGHDMKELIIQPTCNEKGYTKHSCTRCEHSFNDTFIDELGHTYVFYDMDGSTVLKSDRVACGYQINAPDMEMERVIGQFKYLFGGWSQEIPTALTQDIEISAIYKAIRISENIDNAEKQEHKDDEIIIEMPNGIDDNLRLIVKHISDETEIARNNESLLLSEVLSEYSTSYMLDIYLERNDKRSDMLDYSSVIKIRIDDIPNFNIEEFTLVQVNQDGGYDIVSFEIVDDYIVFETNTLGSFLVIERTIGTIYFWWLCIMQAGVLMTLSLYALRRNKKKRNAKENK